MTLPPYAELRRHFVRLAIVSAWVGLAAAAPAPPDLNGVWANNNSGASGDGSTSALPLRLEPKARVDAYRALVAPTGETPGGVCLGAGMPSAILGGASYPLEIIQRPDQITFIYELHGEVRRIYFGARNAAPEDRIPGRNGYSSGRWEGDTLVVETDNLIDQVDGRLPHSETAKVTERYRVTRDDKGGRRLTVDVTLTDPAFYTEPVKVTKFWTLIPNGRLLPYECAEEVWRNRLAELSRKAAP